MSIFKKKEGRKWHREEYRRLTNITANIGMGLLLAMFVMMAFAYLMPIALFGWLFVVMISVFFVIATIASVVHWVDKHEAKIAASQK